MKTKNQLKTFEFIKELEIFIAFHKTNGSINDMKVLFSKNSWSIAFQLFHLPLLCVPKSNQWVGSMWSRHLF